MTAAARDSSAEARRRSPPTAGSRSGSPPAVSAAPASAAAAATPSCPPPRGRREAGVVRPPGGGASSAAYRRIHLRCRAPTRRRGRRGRSSAKLAGERSPPARWKRRRCAQIFLFFDFGAYSLPRKSTLLLGMGPPF